VISSLSEVILSDAKCNRVIITKVSGQNKRDRYVYCD